MFGPGATESYFQNTASHQYCKYCFEILTHNLRFANPGSVISNRHLKYNQPSCCMFKGLHTFTGTTLRCKVLGHSSAGSCPG